MMRTTFDEMKLQPGFTFRVVEALKQTKIQTAPYKTALPYGVSAAAMMIALLFALTVSLQSVLSDRAMDWFHTTE